MKKITLVLPTFNERPSLENFLPKIFAEEKRLPDYQFHLIIADDTRSTDNLGELVKQLNNKNVHYLKIKEPGIGAAFIRGHQYALKKIKPDILVQIDADGQVEITVLTSLITAIEEGYDLALGSRFIKGGRNELPFNRRLFATGSSLICRLIMGPLNIREFGNSARAFTPELFLKLNINRLPWREKTFITQPAFLNEAILAGAKYKEVPLVFRNRHQGYSKNRVVNYTYDVITYAIDARLHKWGFQVDFFKWSHKIKTLIKFGIVGLLGTIVDFVFYNLFIVYFLVRPASAKTFSTEVAIIHNFIFNNLWTFKYRQTQTKLWQKALLFNSVSLGGLIIGVLVVKLLHLIYGDGSISWMGFKIAYYNLYFFVTIPPVLAWNFAANHLITWKKAN